jgi:putative hydrolase of the HAD superfamily
VRNYEFSSGHRPELAHPELCHPDAWWGVVEQLIARAYAGAGIAADRAAVLATLAHEHYVDPAVGWQLIEGAEQVLDELSRDGWRHAILSNHVPELPAIVEGLGLGERFERVFTSAATGYEKPHPQAFAVAREALGRPEMIWMVGDNPVADVDGAEAADIPAILVHGERANGACAATLSCVPDVLSGNGVGARSDGIPSFHPFPVVHARRIRDIEDAGQA